MRSDFKTAGVDELERQLMQSLRKVEPNPVFVDHLHTRLTDPSRPSIERRQSLGVSLFLVAASLISGILLIWLMRLYRPGAA